MYKAGLFTFTVTNKDIPAESPLKLNTDSFEFLIPELYKEYPNTTMETIVTPSVAPITKFAAGSDLSLNAIFEFIFYVLPEGQKPVPVFTLEGKVAGSVQVVMNHTQIAVNISSASVALSVKSSNVGNFTVGLLQDFANDALPILVEYANVEIKKNPISLPAIPHITLKNTTLTYGDSYVEVALDAYYKRDK